MATYDNLPVCKASYDLLLEIFIFSKNMDKEYKYTIGEDLKKETTTMITNVYRANCNQNKRDLIQNGRENLEVIRLYLRLIKDLKQINLLKFVKINEIIESISKQLNFWQNAMKQ